MAGRSGSVEVYLEVGTKRTFAGSPDWPGWCRSGRDEEAALEALVAYGPRYAKVLRGTRPAFAAPKGPSQLSVVERLKGGATTDFGAPEAQPSVDGDPLDAAGVRRSETVLTACWKSFDAAVEGAHGRRLRAGPRGGGRSLAKIVDHVVEADGAYLRALGWKLEKGPRADLIERTRAAMVDGLAASARGEIAPRGPRGGARWPARFFVRRSAWHVLDHAWEIEDRSS